MPGELKGDRPGRPKTGSRVEWASRVLPAVLPIFGVSLVLTAGCRHPGLNSGQTRAHTETGGVVERTYIEPAVQVPPTSLEETGGQRTYWGMTPQSTQCRAAEKSGTAAMMESEYQALATQNCLHRNSKSTQMKKTMLRHASVEARNLASGTALELYYRLAELEAKSDLLRGGLATVEEALTELRKAKEQGLKVPPELAKLENRQLELAADLTRAQLGIEQINGELGRLLGWHELGLSGHVWPVDTFSVTPRRDDLDAAVALGLSQRAQLNLIRSLRDDVDVRTLPTMLLLLRSYNGFLGMGRSETFISFMTGSVSPGAQSDVDKRRRQMDEMLQEQEYVVAQEIRLALHTIDAKTKLVALAKEKITTAQARLKDLQDKRERGTASALDVSTQRLVLGQAQGELIQEVMAWHTAGAKLKQAQGLLALECGYSPEHPWAECP
jgi:hypothetical protein